MRLYRLRGYANDAIWIIIYSCCMIPLLYSQQFPSRRKQEARRSQVHKDVIEVLPKKHANRDRRVGRVSDGRVASRI